MSFIILVGLLDIANGENSPEKQSKFFLQIRILNEFMMVYY